MYASVVTTQINSGMLDEVVKIYKSSIVTAVQQQSGFKSATLLINAASNIAVSTTIWATEAEMLAAEANSHLQNELGKLGKFLTSPAANAHYEVSIQALKDTNPENDPQRTVSVYFEPQVKNQVDRLSQQLQQIGLTVHAENWNEIRETGDGSLHYYADINTSTIYYGSMVEKDALAIQAALQNLDPPIETILKAGGVSESWTTWNVNPNEIKILVVDMFTQVERR